MNSSATIAELAAAFVLAQGEIEAAEKDRVNPAFKSKYTTFAACVAAARPALSKYGLAVLQFPSGNQTSVTVTTRLLHKSGEWIEDALTLPVLKQDAQGFGSAITYGKRYGYCAMVGVVADEDDDGNAASQKPAKPTLVQVNQQTGEEVAGPKGFDSWLTDLESTADLGTEALQKAWKASAAPFRAHLMATAMPRWEAVKARAEQAKVGV